jgi:hypothetical protein
MTHVAPDAYQARFSPNRLTLLTVVLCVGFCTLVVLVPAPLWLRIIIFGGFGLAGLLILAGSLTFQVALRADHAGIMIRRNPFQPLTGAGLLRLGDRIPDPLLQARRPP